MSTQKPLHRRSSHQKNQTMLSPQNTTRRSKSWWVASLLLAAVIGGVIGYFSLPSVVNDIVNPDYSFSAEGVRLFAVSGGCLVFLILMAILNAGIDTIRKKRSSRQVLLGWSGAYLTLAIVGSLIGYEYLPQILLAFARILLGASLGIFGLGLFMVFLAHPRAVLEGSLEGIGLDGCIEGCLEGCFSLTFVLLISMIGVVSGLLIWHSLLLGVLTGGGSALVALIAFVGVVCPSRKGEVFHGSKASAPISNPTHGA